MGFSFETGVPVLTVFLQGVLSFFSPCVLPLVPLYLSYLAGGGKRTDENGQVHFPRKQVLINTIFFIVGIGFTFFLLGFGFTALGQFFNSNRVLLARISGIIMILFGLYQFGIFGRSNAIDREHRILFQLNRWTMGPLPALLLGFTFSFAWTPCVGPVLGSVLLMAGSAASMLKAALLIGVYTIGFTLPFLAVGIFTASILDFFKKHQNIVKYTVKIGAALLILMGIMTLTGFMNGFTNYLSDAGTSSGSVSSQQAAESASSGNDLSSAAESTASSEKGVSSPAESSTTADSSASSESEPKVTPAPDFTLVDQNGKTHKLSDYKGKVVFLNFWATWCPPCKGELPEIQALYEKYGSNEKDLIVLGVAGPNQGEEGSVDHISGFLSDNKYTFPVVMDETGDVFAQYGIYSFPTTFMIDADGNVFGYVSGGLTADMMESIVQQTITGKRVSQ